MAAIPEAYEDLLDSRAVDTLLERVKTSGVFNSINSHSLYLSEGDTSSLLDPETLPWNLFREKILDSIAANRAETKGQVACNTKRHTHKCFQLQRKMSKQKSPVVDLNSDYKTLEWQSSLFSLSIEFTKQVHLGLGRSDDNLDMVASLNNLLATDIMPPEDEQLKRTIYYVASWLAFSLLHMSNSRDF